MIDRLVSRVGKGKKMFCSELEAGRGKFEAGRGMTKINGSSGSALTR